MTAPEMMTNCPADETLAAFIDGTLDGGARADVIEHLGSCAACRDVVNTHYELEPQALRRSWVIPAMTLAAAAAIAAVLFLGPAGERLRMSRHVRALTAATSKADERAIAARPSIDIAYKRHSVVRGPESETRGNADVWETAAAISEIARANPSAANLHKAGVALLLTGGYDRDAVLNLEQAAAKTQDADPDLLNDLAAAYYETGDVDKAKAAIERAWSLKQSAPIAWTRAVVLDTTQAWKDYLAIDPSSEWSAEARTRLANQTGN